MKVRMCNSCLLSDENSFQKEKIEKKDKFKSVFLHNLSIARYI